MFHVLPTPETVMTSSARFTFLIKNVMYLKNWFFPRALGSVTEVYLGPCQTAMMELLCKYSWRLKAVNYLRRNVPPLMRERALNTPQEYLCENGLISEIYGEVLLISNITSSFSQNLLIRKFISDLLYLLLYSLKQIRLHIFSALSFLSKINNMTFAESCSYLVIFWISKIRTENTYRISKIRTGFLCRWTFDFHRVATLSYLPKKVIIFSP